MKLADGINSINMCVIDRIEYDFLYIIDLDGSFRPNPAIAPSISTLVASDNQTHLTFLDSSKCVDNTVGCYSFCHDTCFRSMRYEVEGPGQENYKLKVCSRAAPSKCALFKGGRRGDIGPHEFTAHLPTGQLYDAVFLDGLGNEIEPLKVEELVEKTFCTSGIFEVKLLGALGVAIPPATRPVPPPVRAPIPVRPPAPVPIKTPTNIIPTPVKAPVRSPVPVPVPMKAAPVRPPVPASVPLKAPVRPPVPVPVKAPVRPPVPVSVPVKAPVRPPVPISVPVKAPVRSPVKAPAKKGFFSRIFARIRRK